MASPGITVTAPLVLIEAKAVETVEDLIAKDADSLLTWYLEEDSPPVTSAGRLLSMLFVAEDAPQFALVMAGLAPGGRARPVGRRPLPGRRPSVGVRAKRHQAGRRNRPCADLRGRRVARPRRRRRHLVAPVAGTGKTVVLLHRTRMRARREPDSRVLLTTFTTNLADQLSADLERLDPGLPRAAGLGEPGVSVHGIDSLASAVIKRAGADIALDVEAVLGVGTQQVGGRTPGVAWQDALDAAGSGLPPSLRSPAFLAAEYAQVILPSRVTTRDAYYKVRRPGRVVALDRAKRTAVWEVVQSYRAQARIAATVDFPKSLPSLPLT